MSAMKKVIFLLILGVVFQYANLAANAMGSSMPVKAVGVSGVYRHSFDGDKRDSGILYLSGRYGYEGIVSFLAAADAGYDFRGKNINGKLSFQAMIFFAGLEAGFASKYKIEDSGRNYFPGAYAGLCFAYPYSSESILTVSAGFGIYTVTSENEFLFSCGYLVNFSD